MSFHDPVTLLLIITPFGLMTTLLLCLSYVGLGKDNASLHWWIAGDLLLAAYRIAAMLQPGVPQGALEWMPVMTPLAAFVTGTTLLLAAVGAHTLALLRLDAPSGEGQPSGTLLKRLGVALPLIYACGAPMAVRAGYALPWHSLFMVVTIVIQIGLTLRLARRYRGALGLLAGQTVIVVYHAWSAPMLARHPLPPQAFEHVFLPTVPALMMDVIVSFLFTLSYALALQEQLRLRIVQLSITDSLTGALNRRGAVSILNDAWARASAERHPIAIAMVDLDNFKRINDQYGHSAGDAALQRFADTVTRLKRQSDVFVRWGGEEFLLLLPRTDIGQAERFLARLRDNLKSLPLTPALPFHLEFSAGLADNHATVATPDFEAALRAVDKALYRAKVERDRVEVVSEADV
ncbi:GGDEF domain-containing protein [Cupriavidus plantarum]|uniref:GGDEF domain-containing protein n=1 Tax=Cupriavidus plantarum TaxID=942865 RepID=UPI000E3A7128|nr:GGDEF domain-containing protein [Cupriavidus plantarum]REE92212.1 diguanylate cyclase (GGDEF)-like protein [Cupriavidus plantarum]